MLFLCIHKHTFLTQPRSRTHAHSVDARHKWVTVGKNVDCDWGAGEKYLQSSQPQISSVEQCQKSCEDAAGCKTITFLPYTSWCSHFSTPCTNTIPYNRETVVMRLVDDKFVLPTTTKGRSIVQTTNAGRSGITCTLNCSRRLSYLNLYV